MSVFFAVLLKLCIIKSALAKPPAVRARYLMGTLCEISAHGPGAAAGVEAAFSEIGRLEGVLSAHRADSELSRLNRGGSRAPMRVSRTLWDALARAARLSRASSGAFDPTFASAPAARGMARVRMDASERTVALDPGTVLRLDAFGKGYALDKAADALRSRGVRSALLNFGGQILALGSAPSGSAWPVELAAPGCPPPAAASEPETRCGLPALGLSLRDASVSTSGSSEQGAHIVDPADGRPVLKPSSVSVVAESAAEADAWSTALYARGIASLPAGQGVCAVELTPSPEGSRPAFAGTCRPFLRGGRLSLRMRRETMP